LQLLQNLYLRKVTGIEKWERPNISNIAIELNYLPIEDKVIQLIEKAEKRAAIDPRVISHFDALLSPSKRMFLLHSITKFEEIKKNKAGVRTQPFTRNNLTAQWYAKWKAEQREVNSAFDDFSPRKRLKLYADIKLVEERTILRARTNN